MTLLFSRDSYRYLVKSTNNKQELGSPINDKVLSSHLLCHGEDKDDSTRVDVCFYYI